MNAFFSKIGRGNEIYFSEVYIMYKDLYLTVNNNMSVNINGIDVTKICQ